MKIIILILMSLLMYQTAFGKARYQIKEGKLHRNGKASIEVLDDPNLYKVKMDYVINKKKLVPVPSKYLEGETVINLPSLFKDERGYLELEKEKEMEVDGAKLVYLGRTTLREFSDAHKIRVFLKNGKSKIELIYHPTLPGTGWDQIKIIFISDVPLLDGYTIICHLKD